MELLRQCLNVAEMLQFRISVVKSAYHAARRDPELQRFYRRKLVQKGLGKARMAVARKVGIQIWIMLRNEIDYHQFCRRGQKQQNSGAACAGMPETRYGATQSPAGCPGNSPAADLSGEGSLFHRISWWRPKKRRIRFRTCNFPNLNRLPHPCFIGECIKNGKLQIL